MLTFVMPMTHNNGAGLPLPPAAAHQGEPSAAANVTGFVNVEPNNYQAVMTAIATNGPMAISVDAGDWHDYESGVFDGGNKTNPELDHLVQLVGYASAPFTSGGVVLLLVWYIK